MKDKLQLSIFGLGEGDGGEAFGWTRHYSFIYIKGKKANISDLSKVLFDKRNIIIFPLWVGGGRGGEASWCTKTYLFVYLIGR